MTPTAERRFLDAVTRVCARDGYADTTVERVLAAAASSRATFYQYFSSVEDCFLSAYRVHALELVDDLASAPAGEQRELAVVDALVGLAIRRPHVALLLSREGLAAGLTALRERQALIAAIERVVMASPASADAIDLPPGILVGGFFRFLSMRLADGPVTPALAEEIRQWARALTRPRHLCLSARLLPSFPENVGEARLPTTSVVRSPAARERLLRATAAVILAKGYRAATVADIVAAAGSSRRHFYDHFPSKRAAFVALYEHAFAQAITACAPAFFGSSSWPDRVWDTAVAFTRFFASEPTFAQLGFVECHALGPSFLGRVHDTQLAFTLFLEEGYRQRPQSACLPRVCSALTAVMIFEAGFRACRAGPSLYMRRIQPLVYMVLAPFIGLDEAGLFVSEKLRVVDSNLSARP
jgi:AcrR family transcriptional regulator